MTISNAISATDLLSDLIRIDTTNTGDVDGPGERAAAEYAAEYAAEHLTDAGLTPELLESAPRRANLVTRWPGIDSTRPPLLVHGHLDVVPAQAEDWSVPPFAGEVKDGFVWGRGAIDMKQFIAQLVALVELRQRESRPPARDVLLVLTADEEHSGQYGAYWLADKHRALFDGVIDAMGEGGGFSLPLPSGRRLYPVGTGEKGMMWTRVVAEGRAGHGSMVNRENAVTRLAQAIARVGSHEFPVQLTPTVIAMLEVIAAELGVARDVALADPEALFAGVDTIGREFTPSVRHMANPTMAQAGYKANVIPGAAEAVIDARILPGLEGEFLKTLDELLGPHIRREAIVHDAAHEGPLDGRVVRAIEIALGEHDSDGRMCPYLDVGAPMQRRSCRSGSTATASHPCGFLPTNLILSCTTVLTNACPSTAWSGASKYSTVCLMRSSVDMR